MDFENKTAGEMRICASLCISSNNQFSTASWHHFVLTMAKQILSPPPQSIHSIAVQRGSQLSEMCHYLFNIQSKVPFSIPLSNLKHKQRIKRSFYSQIDFVYSMV